jgi:hypothetical protein
MMYFVFYCCSDKYILWIRSLHQSESTVPDCGGRVDNAGLRLVSHFLRSCSANTQWTKALATTAEIKTWRFTAAPRINENKIRRLIQQWPRRTVGKRRHSGGFQRSNWYNLWNDDIHVIASKIR